MYYTVVPSPLGPLTLASNGPALVGLWLENQKYFPTTLPQNATPHPDLPIFRQTHHWLNLYFSGARPAIDSLPLAPAGSAFRQIVWEILREIPYGEVTTYGAIGRETARRLGRETMAGQAIGGAVGHNPISIIIPCHRVVGAGGQLTGYAGGVEKKAWLLRHEASVPLDPGRGVGKDTPSLYCRR